MKPALFTLCAVLSSVALRGESMPRSVSSWEGEFVLVSEAVSIAFADLPALKVWTYLLAGGSAGTALGFSDLQGTLLLAPKPTNRGVQPIYRSHFVSFTPSGMAEIIIAYDVQGQGGVTFVEAYAYDGKTVDLVSTSSHGGRHDPVWRRMEIGANQLAEATPLEPGEKREP